MVGFHIFIITYIFRALMGNLPAIFEFSHVKSGGKVTFPGFSATFSSSALDKPRSSHSRKHAGLNNHNNVFYLRAAGRKKIAQKDCLLFFFFSPPSEYQNGLPCHRRGEAMTPPNPSPSFSAANWKTSVIILILAQIWRDQRWPAGCGRGADGCMLAGTRQRPFRF